MTGPTSEIEVRQGFWRLADCLGAQNGEEVKSFSVLGAWLGGVDHDAQVGTGHGEHVACPERQHRYTTVE